MIKRNPFAADAERGFTFAQLILTIVAATLLCFAFGVVVGLGAAVAESGIGNPWKLALAMGVAGGLLAVALAILRRQARLFLSEPVAPNVRRARWILGAILVFGMILGFILMPGTSLADMQNASAITISPLVAIVSITLWVVVAPALTLLWWRQVDELEHFAYRDGAFWTLHFYALVTPSWWVGWRAGLFIEPMHMAIFLASMVVWSIAWLIRRYG